MQAAATTRSRTSPSKGGVVHASPENIQRLRIAFPEDLAEETLVFGELFELSHDAAGGAVLTEEDRQILSFLSAGLKDASIARQLHIGIRTVQRRIRRLMDLAGVETRFQAGLEAARRGWL